jgi:hypothetical protein
MPAHSSGATPDSSRLAGMVNEYLQGAEEYAEHDKRASFGRLRICSVACKCWCVYADACMVPNNHSCIFLWAAH